MDSFLSFQVVLLTVSLLSVHAGFITIHPQDDHWYKIGTPAVVECEWEYENDGNTTGEVLGWKTGEVGIRKITKGDPESTFVFGNSPIPEDRQGEETEWEGVVKVGRLTIYDYQISDPNDFTCEVEANQHQSAKPMHIYQYGIPSVSMRDVQVSVDVRPPLPETSSNETTVSNGTTSETIPDEDEEDDDNSDYYPNDEAVDQGEKIIVECVIERAYPEPTNIEFVISETTTIPATSTNIEQIKDGDDKGYYEGYATLELQPDTEYDGKEISCQLEIPTKPDAISVKSSNTSSTVEIFHTTTWVSATISPPTAAEGENVEIKCYGNGNPKPSFTVSPSQNVQGPSTPGVFGIYSVRRTDAGEYTCEAAVEDRSNPGKFETLQGIETLTVDYMDEPTLSEEVIEKTVTKGEQVFLECTGHGSPSVNVKWMHDGKEVGDKGRLDIDSIRYDEEGEYTCISTSTSSLIKGETKKKNINIKVEGACEAKLSAPVISSSQSEEHAFHVKLECEVTGQPACQVAINSPQNFNAEGVRTTVNEGLYTLEYKELQMLPSPATFFCVASNSAGSPANVSYILGESTDVCCNPPKQGGLSTGAIIGIILLVLVVVIGIPVACYFVRRKKAEPKKKSAGDMEAAEPEKEELNKGESSEDSDTGSLPPPPAETNDHRLNSAHEMTTFSTNQ